MIERNATWRVRNAFATAVFDSLVSKTVDVTHRGIYISSMDITNAVANENTYALTRNAIREGIFEAIEYEQ
jgi:hypothetical protein